MLFVCLLSVISVNYGQMVRASGISFGRWAVSDRMCLCAPPLALGPTGTCQVVEFSLISEERFVGRLNNDTLLQATFRKLDGGRWRAEWTLHSWWFQPRPLMPGSNSISTELTFMLKWNGQWNKLIRSVKIMYKLLFECWQSYFNSLTFCYS